MDNTKNEVGDLLGSGMNRKLLLLILRDQSIDVDVFDTGRPDQNRARKNVLSVVM
jgi:hypothetical protein